MPWGKQDMVRHDGARNINGMSKKNVPWKRTRVAISLTCISVCRIVSEFNFNF